MERRIGKEGAVDDSEGQEYKGVFETAGLRLSQKKLTLTELRSAGEEPEPTFASITDFYWVSFPAFPHSWEQAFIGSQKAIATSSSGEESIQPFPYLIAPFFDKEMSVMICSKPLPSLYQKQVKKEDPELFLKRYVMREFLLESTEESRFRDDLRLFLNKTAAEGLEPIGCVNDFSNNRRFYFFFFNTGLVTNEEEVELNDIFTCVTLKGKEPDQTAIALTNWANNKGFCYRLSFPVYNEAFTALQYQAIILERSGFGKQFTYFLIESDPKVEMFQKVNIADTNQEFIGVMTYPRVTYTVYNLPSQEDDYER